MKFFDNIKFFLENSDTGLMSMAFKCKECGTLMSEPDSYKIPVENGLITKVWESEFWCKKCNTQRLKQLPENEKNTKSN